VSQNAPGAVKRVLEAYAEKRNWEGLVGNVGELVEHGVGELIEHGASTDRGGRNVKRVKAAAWQRGPKA